MEKLDFKTKSDNLPQPEIVQKGIVSSKKETASNSKESNSNNDPDEVWKILKEQLRMHVSERDMNIWYKNVYLEKIENGVAELSCKSSLEREWIESNHRAFLRNKIEEVIGYKPDLIVSIRSSAPSSQSQKDKYEYFDPKQTQAGQQGLFSSDDDVNSSSQDSNSSSLETNLNPKYMLSNFIVGTSNQLAHAVSESVVENPGTSYNPVFFYGPSGVGKTHLMQAIGNALLRRNPSFKVVYVPIETFMNDMIEAIRTRKNEEFRQKYRPVDLLMIDDIQFISTLKKTKEELFNTFNALYQANKQIVIASDRPPKEIENLPDRLRTRFEGGMVIDIQSPDLETRLAILQQQLREQKTSVPNEVVMFIAQNVESSVRELEGAIIKVITHTKFTGKVPTVESVAEMLQLDIDSKRKRLKPEKIISVVSDVFNIQPKDIRGKRRTAHIALARQTVMFFLREELELPLEQIARLVNRKDHTTVLHACNKIEELCANDSRMQERVVKCKDMLIQ